LPAGAGSARIFLMSASHKLGFSCQVKT
jgi:hypothetical protein